MNELVEILVANNITISSVESFTAGSFAALLGSVPNVSKVYRGSLITYQNSTKERLLGIEKEIIANYGVVSKEVASLMCVNGKHIMDSDICVSFTGNAGPSSMEGKPVGFVYIGVAYAQEVKVYQLELSGTRKEIQQQAIQFAVKKLLQQLKVN